MCRAYVADSAFTANKQQNLNATVGFILAFCEFRYFWFKKCICSELLIPLSTYNCCSHKFYQMSTFNIQVIDVLLNKQKGKI